MVEFQFHPTSINITARISDCEVFFQIVPSSRQVDSCVGSKGQTTVSTIHGNDPRMRPIIIVFLVEMAFLACIAFVLLY